MAENTGENRGEIPQQEQFEAPLPLPAEGQERQTERTLEQQTGQETAPAKQTPQFPTPAPVAPPAAQQTQATQADSSSKQAASTSGIVADDVDLIEKQWVERAKNIIAQTQDDPRKQKDEISKVKVEYIKKRFNKTIPVDDKAP